MAEKKELLEQSQKSFENFMSLSKYLLGEDAPMDVNEIPKDNEFYKAAKEMADEMELDWDKMSHEDSIRVMINLLADAYANIQTDEDYIPVLTVSFKKKG